MKRLLVGFAVCTALSGFSELAAQGPVFYPESVFGNRGEGVNKRWDWEFLGPDVQPFELNPGGKAIPAYAADRGNGSGRINYVYPDPYFKGRVFACSPTGGLFLSHNEGESWEVAGTDRLPVSGVSSIATDPEDRDVWFIATGDGDDNFMFSDGIWRTEDGGNRYVNINGRRVGRAILPTEDPLQYLVVSEVVWHGCEEQRLFAATNMGLYTCDNPLDEPEKIRWRRVAEGQFYDLWVSPDQPNVLLAGGSVMFRSNDCGKTWFEESYPRYPDAARFPFSRLAFQAVPEHNGVLVAVSCSERASQSTIGEGSLHYFDLDTRKWEYVRSLKTGMDNFIPTRGRAFAIHPTNQNLVMVANVQPIYRSTDAGATFTGIDKNQMHDDVHHIAWSADGKTAWAGHDGGVSVSFDEGLTWVARDKGIGAANVFGLSVAQTPEHKVLFGAYDTGGNLLSDSIWYHVTWGDGFETIIDPSDPNVMYATKQNGHIHRSSTEVLDFDTSVTSGKTKTEWHTWIRAHTKRPNVIFCSGTKLIRSTDRGDKWDVILDAESLEGQYLTIFRFFVSEHHPNVIYAYVLDQSKIKPALYRTFNSGADNPNAVRWEKVQTIPKDGWITSLVIDADNAKQFWMSYKSHEPQGKLYRFNNERYIDVSSNLGWCIVESMVMDRNSEERLYVGTNHGVFTRSKREKQWTRLTGLPGTFVKSMAINYANQRLYVGTYGRGVWHAPLLVD